MRYIRIRWACTFPWVRPQPQPFRPALGTREKPEVNMSIGGHLAHRFNLASLHR
jgi:hypothetical protein